MNRALSHKHEEKADHVTRTTPNDVVTPKYVLSLNSNDETEEREKYRRYDIIESQTQKKDIRRLLEQTIFDEVRNNDEKIPEE
jgi:hypothetical protein